MRMSDVAYQIVTVHSFSLNFVLLESASIPYMLSAIVKLSKGNISIALGDAQDILCLETDDKYRPW